MQNEFSKQIAFFKEGEERERKCGFIEYPSIFRGKVLFFEWDKENKRQFQRYVDTYGNKITQTCIRVKEQSLNQLIVKVGHRK